MKKYPWTNDSVMFMCRAAERSEYNSMLAAHIACRLTGSESVFEPGCGTGGLSLALAPFVGSLHASDIDPLPLEALKRQIAERGITNISVSAQDIFALPDTAVFDAVVFCYFAMPEQILAFSKSHIKKHVFVVKRAYARHRFSSADIPITGDSLARMCALLEEKHIPYEKELLSAEMGQPLRDADEARRFLALYSRSETDSVMTDELLLRRLEKTGDPEFPYCLPSRKEVGLIHFSAEDL